MSVPREGRAFAINIGARIRSLRLEKGLSQGDVEKRSRLLRCYLSRVEHGHTQPSLETLKRLADAFGVQLADFFPPCDIPDVPQLAPEDLEFMRAINRFKLTRFERKVLVAMAKEWASVKDRAVL